MDVMQLPEQPDYNAPDGSEIRLLPQTPAGGLAHCSLPAGRSSSAVRHRTVEEIWFVLGGEGQLWRKYGQTASITALRRGTAVKIPCQVHFQFRNTGTTRLEILISTMPAWPGPDEAVPVEGAATWS